MTGTVQYAKYDTQIKQIKKRKTKASIMLVCALILNLIFSIGFDLNSLMVMKFEGLGIGFCIAVSIIILFIYLLVIGNALAPTDTSLTVECDPEKHLILNSALTKGKNLYLANTVALTFLGNYSEALPYAIMLSEDKSKKYALTGYFYKFRCQFLMGEYEKAKISAEKYCEILHNEKKFTPKVQEAYDKMYTAIQFMLAVSANDTEAQKELFDALTPWNSSLAAGGFVNYLKGLYAYNTVNMEEAIFRFKYVIEYCPKTIFAVYSKDYLEKLKKKMYS